MMHGKLKIHLLDKLIDHLHGMQGADLHGMLPKKIKGPHGPDDPSIEEMGEKPHGIAVEKVEIMKKPKEEMGMPKDMAKAMMNQDHKEPDEDEMGGLSDEDLDDLLKKFKG